MDEKDRTARLILYTGWGFAIASFAFLFMVTFLPLPATGVEHAKTIVGFLLGVGISTILQYYWGSSSGSADKSAVIAEELNGPSSPVTSQTVTLKSTETIDKTTESVKPVIVEEVKP
jgi:hypothetical protein